MCVIFLEEMNKEKRISIIGNLIHLQKNVFSEKLKSISVKGPFDYF